MFDGLTNRDRQLLRMAVVLHAILAEPAKKQNDGKPRWLQVLESATIAALVTVVLGGVAGNIVVGRFQEREKERARIAADAKERAERRTVAIHNAYDLLADARYHAYGLVRLTEPDFQLANVEEADRADLQKQRAIFVESANAFSRRWQKERYTTGFVLSYYHENRPEVRKAWDASVVAVEQLRRAAASRYAEYLQNPGRARVAEALPEETRFVSAIEGLATQIETARRQEGVVD